VVAAGGYVTVRYLGIRAGWWSTLLPMEQISAAAHAVWSPIHALFVRAVDWINR